MTLLRRRFMKSIVLAFIPFCLLHIRPATAAEVAIPPANERCALARRIVQEMVRVRDFERRWLGARPDRWSLMLSLKSNRHTVGPEVPLLRSKAGCAEVKVEHAYGVPGDVRVTLGQGNERELQPETLFDVARMRRSGPLQWEVSWDKTDSILNCPKGKACLGAPRILLPLPTWQATIIKSSSGTFEVKSSALEFTRMHRREPDPRASTAWGDLPLNDRCEAVKRMAGEIVKVVDYSEWYALPEASMVMRLVHRKGQVDPGTAGSPFHRSDRCDGMKVHHFYAPGASLAVELEGGLDVPKGTPQLDVEAKALSKGRWELSWAMDKRLWTCPQPGREHYVGGCLDPGSGLIPTPTLHVVVVKVADEGLAVEASWLEMDDSPKQDPSSMRPPAPPGR